MAYILTLRYDNALTERYDYPTKQRAVEALIGDLLAQADYVEQWLEDLPVYVSRYLLASSAVEISKAFREAASHLETYVDQHGWDSVPDKHCVEGNEIISGITYSIVQEQS